MSTINKFFIIYNDGLSAVAEYENYHKKELSKSKHYHYIQYKLHEIEILLRYSDLESFAEHVKSKKDLKSSLVRFPPNKHIEDMSDWTLGELFANSVNNEENPDNFGDDVEFIENALAEEFSLLFYIGLLRDNNHKASDYPLTTGFIPSSSNLMYPKDFLMDIVRSDDEIRRRLEQWTSEATLYQELALKQMSKFINRRKKDESLSN